MKTRLTYLKPIALLLGLAALAAPTAQAGQPETEQIAVYLSGVVTPPPTPAESGRAEAKQIAAYLSGVVTPQSTLAESGRAEAKAFAAFLSAVTAPSYPTSAESGRAEAKQISDYLRGTLPQPQVTVYGPGGFDWGDAAIGAGFVGGIALLAVGAALAVRRRRVLAHLAR